MKFHQVYTLIGSFSWKYIKFQLKSIEELYLITLKSDAKFEEKLTWCLKNNIRNLENFYPSTRKSQNWDFDGIHLSKGENVWA